MINGYADYLNMNAFEWSMFILAMVLIAGLLFLVPMSLAIARKYYGVAESAPQDEK